MHRGLTRGGHRSNSGTGPYRPTLGPNSVSGQASTRRSSARGIPGLQGPALDPAFKARPRKFFHEGRVFRGLWAETAGSGSAVGGDVVPGNLGENVCHKIRRFVVIRCSDTYCEALAIYTYGGQACAKPGILPQEHAIVYTGNTCPPALDGELPCGGKAGLLEIPIRVIPDNPRDPECLLSDKSRIDFGKCRTVEFYSLAASVGRVHADSMSALMSQFSDIRDPLYRQSSVNKTYLEPILLRKRVWGSKTPTDEEPFDDRYRVQSPRFYHFAKIFCLLTWNDDDAVDEGYDDSIATIERLPDPNNANAFIDAPRRWFVVIGALKDASLCLPIVSYQGQGVQEGYHRHLHSILHAEHEAPQPEASERNRGKDPHVYGPPLRVRKYDLCEALKFQARLRYNTVYEVKHDVKARSFGYISSQCTESLKQYFNAFFPESQLSARAEWSDRSSSNPQETRHSRIETWLESPVQSSSKLHSEQHR